MLVLNHACIFHILFLASFVWRLQAAKVYDRVCLSLNGGNATLNFPASSYLNIPPMVWLENCMFLFKDNSIKMY